MGGRAGADHGIAGDIVSLPDGRGDGSTRYRVVLRGHLVTGVSGVRRVGGC